MKENTLYFMKKIDEKTKEPQIYLNDALIRGYPEMLKIIIKNKNSEFEFYGFNKKELKGIEIFMIEYSKYLNNISKRTHLAMITHTLRYYDQRSFFLTKEGDNTLDYLELADFETIDQINFKNYHKDFNILEVEVKGTICLYGIKNNYGFYDVNSDELISSETIKREEMKVSTVEDKKRNVYIRERIK